MLVKEWVPEGGVLDVPLDDPLQYFEQKIRQGDWSKGFGVAIVIFAWFGYEDDLVLPPAFGCIPVFYAEAEEVSQWYD